MQEMPAQPIIGQPSCLFASQSQTTYRTRPLIGRLPGAFPVANYRSALQEVDPGRGWRGPDLQSALRYLAECRANREKMRSELGMMLSLQNVIQKTTTPGDTQFLASEICDLLQSSSTADGDCTNEMNSRRRKAQFFLGATNKRAKTVVLHIDGLDDTSRRSLCEDALLKIKGVISFTFQMAVQRCVVRIRSDLKAEALATAIASTKVMKAQQVVKGETGEELLVPFQDTSVDVEQNTDLPDYLPEDESPMKEQDKAVSRVGALQDGGSSWLSTAANFLSRSFYW
ncbi:armadillo repeat-containing protein 1 [Hyla sarda]|uniref:armadillo repeat-containing protein 1 n=1 Tax=Hyla sarda TaxID=327740 RepID=UPI0024C3FD1A|nr:armadillo repeat-containing protein 1 [Hyla sarda]